MSVLFERKQPCVRNPVNHLLITVRTAITLDKIWLSSTGPLCGAPIFNNDEVELVSFTPLVFATTGGMGREAVTFYRRLAELISKRKPLSYGSTLAWLRCTMSFSLIRSVLREADLSH